LNDLDAPLPPTEFAACMRHAAYFATWRRLVGDALSATSAQALMLIAAKHPQGVRQVDLARAMSLPVPKIASAVDSLVKTGSGAGEHAEGLVYCDKVPGKRQRVLHLTLKGTLVMTALQKTMCCAPPIAPPQVAAVPLPIGYVAQ
jgi:DNA-binding MarR family transcriptional regulator